MVRRVVAAPMFELLRPLFLALCLLRAQIGEDLFTRRSLSGAGGGSRGRRRRRAGWDISTTRRTSASCEVRVSAGRR